MKFQYTQIILLFAQNFLLTARFVELFSMSQNSPPDQHSSQIRAIDSIKDPSENNPINANTTNIKNDWYFHPEFNVADKKSSWKTKSYFSEYGKYINNSSPRTLTKRSVSSDSEQSGNRSHTTVELLYSKNRVNNSTLQLSNVLSIQTPTTNSSNDYSNFSVLNATVENLQSALSPANKSMGWFIFDFTNQRSDNTSVLKNSLFIEDNTSDIFFINLQQNKTYTHLCHEQYNENGCMLSNVVIDLQNLFHVLNANETNLNILRTASNDLINSSIVTLHNLTQNFNCMIHEIDGFNISCTNVTDFYSIGEYLPNDTVALDLSFSFRIKLLTPLFPHLKRLKSLTLSNNHHRYITKAFMGLENLEELDLSSNDIIALIKAFSYIPKLKVLDLSGNQFRTVKVVSNAVSYLKDLHSLFLNDNYHVSYLTKQDLSGLKNCKIEVFSLFNTTIRYVERGAFNSMPILKVLEISVNYMNEYSLANITCDMAETIETVYFRLMLNVKSFPYDAVNCLKNTKLKELHLGNNYIKIIPVLPSLPNLQLFSMPNSSLEIIEINAFQNITTLERINLRNNKLANFPSALSSVRRLKELLIDSQISDYQFENFIIEDYTFQNLTNLDTLRLSLLRIVNLSRYTLYGLKKLKLAFLSLAGLYKIYDYAFETLTSLIVLDLRGNGISSLSNFTFFGLKSLEQLYLNSNKIKFVSSIYPFQHSPLINIILLQTNVIRTIPKGMFSNLEDLKMLVLGKNRIIPWQERIFHPNASLRLLALSENNIDFISDAMLAEFHQITENLDLNKNPFNCSKCGMKKFQSFIQNSNLSFELPLPETKDLDYICVNPESMQNQLFLDVDLPKLLCEEIESEILSLITIVLISLFLIVTILMSSLCYTFRWYIRYWIFHFQTTLAGRKGSFREKNYAFDAFIIYSSVDTEWVEDHLIPSLEEQEPRYKLCVHQRDFEVGKPITENILEAIENSHKVVLILTEGFIKSEWCMYELHLAQHKLFDDTRDILILVKLRAIEKKFYTKNVSYIEKTRKCYMWTDNHIGQKLFWEQIRKHLGSPRTSQNSMFIAL